MSKSKFAFTVIPFSSDEAKSKLSTIQTTGLLIPSQGHKIIKNECVLSCDTLESPNGLFVNLATYESVGSDFLEMDSRRTPNHSLYLQIRKVWRRKLDGPASGADLECPRENHPTRLALGVEGGFPIDTSKLIGDTFYSLYLSNEKLLIPLNDQSNLNVTLEDLQKMGCCEYLGRMIKAVIDYSPSSIVERGKGWDEELTISKYSHTLKQISNPPTIPSSHWKCQHCGNTQNQWMHLTDGYIGCGRKLYGVKTSGCLTGEEGAAVRHYEEDKENRTLAVKLGTITVHSADVYSYPEDAMVVDLKLKEHLEYFNINIQQTEKTEKTLSEMEVDYNKNFDWSKILEEGVELKLLEGKGHIGLKNFGNTCYLNASIQLLSRAYDLTKHLTSVYPDLLNCLQQDSRPAEDVLLQYVKVLSGLTSDRYIKQRNELLSMMEKETREFYVQENPQQYISPLLLRACATQQHHEFRTSRQHDAEEFIRYFLQQLENSVHRSSLGVSTFTQYKSLISDLFSFKVEEKRRIVGTSKVRVSLLDECILPLSLPIESTDESLNPNGISSDMRQAKKARSLDTVESETQCRLQNALDFWSKGEIMEYRTTNSPEGNTFSSPHLLSVQSTRYFKTFPPFLLLQLKRFCLGPNWTAQKITSPIEMPESIDLNPYRATGLGSLDVEWTDEEEKGIVKEDAVGVSKDEDVISAIQNLGFHRNAAVRSIHALGRSAPLENYINWVISHLDDPEIHEPLPQSVTPSTKVLRTSPELMELGLRPLQIEAAMLSSHGDLQQATEWMFSVGMDMGDEELRTLIQSYDAEASDRTRSHGDEKMHLVHPDGEGQYELVGFISHMGTTTECGHYVCHIREESPERSGQFVWVLYNDTKVAESQHPPRGLGYIYLYRRVIG